MSEALDGLRRELGGEVPQSFTGLDADEIQRLAATLEKARVEQDEALEQALEHGLEIVPRMLRGTVRKALFG